MRNTKRVSCLCSLSFEYAQQEKYRIVPTTPKFRESYRFVENQPNHYFRGRSALSMIGILSHLKFEPIFCTHIFCQILFALPNLCKCLLFLLFERYMLKDNLSVCWKVRAWPGRVVHAPVAKTN